eukprot:64320_1
MPHETVFELLVSGLSKRLDVPLQLKLLIKQYYTKFYFLPINTYIAYNYTSSILEMSLFNVITDQKESYNTYNYNKSFENNDGIKHTINNTTLPIDIQTLCNKDGTNPLSTNHITSNKWSMTVQIGSNICELNAFPSSLQVPDGALIYGLYKFTLPSFPLTSSKFSQKPTAITFDANTQILYGMNSYSDMEYIQKHSHKIYYLDFTETNYDWKTLSGSIKNRFNTTCCMVDNRFLAILGGDTFGDASKTAEIYSLNFNKSVSIKDMEIEKDFAFSLYHETFHRIIVVDTFKEKNRYYRSEDKSYSMNHRLMEWHDINKDRWMVIENDIEMKQLSNVFVSQINPNILFFVGRSGQNIRVNRFDLRNCKGYVLTDLYQVLSRNNLRYDVCTLFL